MTAVLPRVGIRVVRSVRLAIVVGTALLLACLVPVPAQAAEGQCRDIHVPVTVPGTPDATVYGRLCTPNNANPTTVQLLVPGSTLTHTYYDWPDKPGQYSYVQRALQAGYATLSVDRIGSGESARPISSQITLEVGADTLHEVISQLRSGQIVGQAFSRVIWVGHSLGSIYAWVEASRHQDVDAFVLTAMTHAIKPSFVPVVASTYYPATLDPKFANSGYDPGYLTTMPDAREAQFFYVPGVDQHVLERDERLKNTVSSTEFNQAVSLITAPPPETAPSRQILVPTLLVVGDHDSFFCGPPDGIECTKEAIRDSEAPYYHPDANLDVTVAVSSGHSSQLHLSAPDTTNRILDWVDTVMSR